MYFCSGSYRSDDSTVSVEMVVLTGSVVAATVILPGVGTSATAGAAVGYVHTVAAGGTTATAVAGATGAGAAAGAIAGAAASGTASGAAVGAGVGGAAGAGVTAAGAGTAGLTAGVALGPVGWLALGASEEPTTSAYTFDCWKQVVHDTSPEPSSGRLLREIVVDPRVKQVTTSDDNSTFPEIILENIWNEKYRIEYVQLLPTDQLAAHAVLMSS